MNKKYVFLDLDGTLIDHATNRVSKKTVEAIKKGQENGHEFFICTGRIPALFHGVEETLGIHNYIAANGKLVMLHGEIIRNEFMTEGYVNEFVDYVYDKKIDVAFESFDAYILNSHFTKTTDQFLERFHLKVTDTVKDYHKTNRVYQMNLMFTGDYHFLEERFPYFNFSQANEYGLDVVEGEGMKEQGVKAVVEKLGIPIEDTIAFGDGYNDLSMIEYVGLGVAMGNANQALKDRADYITKDVSEEGIYSGFEHLGLLKK